MLNIVEGGDGDDICKLEGVVIAPNGLSSAGRERSHVEGWLSELVFQATISHNMDHVPCRGIYIIRQSGAGVSLSKSAGFTDIEQCSTAHRHAITPKI